MAAQQTFNCPHCGATYPFKQVLVDRAVRCTTCKNPFRLQADGVAVVVQAGPATARHMRPADSAASSSASRSSGEHQPHSAAASPSGRASSGEHKPQTAPARTASRTRSSARMTMAHERKRQALSSNLSQAATQALTQVVKKEGKGPRTERIGKSASGTAERTKSSKEISPPVLTGEGSKPRLLPWWVWPSGLAVVALLMLWILWPQSPQSQVIREFGAGHATFLAGSGAGRLDARSDIIAPGGEIQVISGLRRHRLGSVEVHSLQPVSDIIGNLRPLGHWSLWIDQAHRQQGLAAIQDAEAVQEEWRQEVRRITQAYEQQDSASDPWAQEWGSGADGPELPPAPPSPREHFQAMVQEHDWSVRSESELRSEIAAVSRSGQLFERLFRGADAPLRGYASQGAIPRRIQVQHFTGQRGLWAMGFGDPVEVAYQGQLLRFSGNGADGRWRLWQLQAR